MMLAVLILGLILLLGAHLVPTFPELRRKLIGRLGEGAYRGLFTLVSILGLVLIVWGFAAAPFIPVWYPPVWTRHLALVLMLPAVVLIVAAYVPGRIKATLRHPFLAGVKIWALAHLLANGDVASMLLFGALLAYGVYDRVAVKRREAAAPIHEPAHALRNDAIAVVAGLAAYALIVAWLHPLLIGVPVLP